MSLNPEIKFAKSKGVDLPTMYVYLAGRIAGNCIEKCLDWRYKIVKHYREYKRIYGDFCGNCQISLSNNSEPEIRECNHVCYESYPIAFLDALNSKEADSIDKQGLTSAIPPNMIYDKDLMSVKKCDVLVAFMDDFMEEGLEEYLIPNDTNAFDEAVSEPPDFDYIKAYNLLKETILNRRPNWGTNSEVAWALLLQKPLILIGGTEKRTEMLRKHPFTKRASVIVKDVDELIKGKYLQILYKSISGATYE